ncbi:MAG: zinc-binding alcohol dehydrogenase [Xanthomonadales bacterium]|nr:zinc-binding alcohol dehydrogenase [Xanthomonadales bacterium]
MPQRIVFPDRGKVELQHFDLPATGPAEVRVKTHYSLISIGTETTILHQRYAPDSHFAKRFSFPQLKTGVQAVGEIEQAGAEVSGLAAGDRVFFRMAHGSHQVLPASAVTCIPAGVDMPSACWCGLAKTAFRAAWAGKFAASNQVLIIGAGPVGQMLVRWAHVENIQHIAVVDQSADRLQHASRGGSTTLILGDLGQHLQQVSQIAAGLGPALVVDTTGNPAVFQNALAVAARFGKVILLGDTGFPQRQCLSSDLMTKGLTIQAVHESHDRDGWTQGKVDELFFSYVLSGRFDLSGLMTHEFTPLECQQAYALAELHRERAMGILFNWTDSDMTADK